MSGNSWLWILFPGRCGRLGPSWGVGATGDDANAGVTGQGCGEVGATPALSRRQPGTPKYLGVEAMHPLTGLNVHKAVVHTQVCAQVHTQGEDLHTRVHTGLLQVHHTHLQRCGCTHRDRNTCGHQRAHGQVAHVISMYRYAQVQEHAQALASAQRGAHLGYRYTHRCAGTWMCSTHLCVHTGSHPLGGTTPHGSTQELQRPPRHPKHQGSTADPHPTPCWWQWKPLGFDPKTRFTLPFERPRWSTKSWGCEEGVCQCHAAGAWIAMGKLRQEQGGQCPGC